MISIINYELGNVISVQNALNKLREINKKDETNAILFLS